MKTYDVIIIGSGAAAYSAADWLYKENIKDIAVVTENRLSGTSRNTGSDKQTYYKISMDGKTQDSPYRMAADLYSAGSCDGVKAYRQAVNSMRCFLRLYDYGVNFPTDGHGGFPGYKTDHDDTTRATSVGPLTSKFMTEKLEDVVINKNKTAVLDNRQVVEIITENGAVSGIVALDTATQEFETILAKNVICATGAPACIYEDSVYPVSQHGMTGVILKAGARLCNYSQWQYGMASQDFRWNVSGSFMQVIPRFVSVDENGEEREFLKDYFEDLNYAYSLVFLKGYQWPFSFARMNESSAIDIAVHKETSSGRKVYLDYIKNPGSFCFEKLSDEAKEYILKTDCLADTPIERLFKLNSKAIDVYARQNIDLYSEKLRIAVSAQHNNGGIHTDENYQTDVKGLYVIGEAAGTFGLARPGGSALNDTQVGGLLAAKHIKNNMRENVSYNCAADKYTRIKHDFVADESVDYSFVKKAMSDCCSFIRDKEKCIKLLEDVTALEKNYPLKHKNLMQYFYDRDMLISAKALLQTVTAEMSLTGSRGGAVFVSGGEVIPENTYYRDYVTITEKGSVTFEKTRAVPEENRPFESYLSEMKGG